MHEMAIAQGILDIVLNTARQNEAEKITVIKLLVGQMTQVVPESLQFGFAALAQGTIAQDAKLDIQIIPLKGCCGDCRQEFLIEQYRFICPDCHSARVEIVSGRELAVDYLEVE